MSTLSIPEYCLVLLVGPTGSGKSSFAAKHFRPTEIISSDQARAMVADDETDQSATKDAFDVVFTIAEKRLAARRLTVIDATNVRREDRAGFVRLAKQYHALTVALVFDIDEKICHARNQQRENRQFGLHVPRKHRIALRGGLKRMSREGIRFVHHFKRPEDMDAVDAIERDRLWTDKRDLTGPFDIIGDVHGCAGELEALLERLGYGLNPSGEAGHRHYEVTPPDGRMAVFVGDLTDRGPRSPDVLRLVKHMVEAGTALCVRGNHDDKLARWMGGRQVKIAHGLQETIDQIQAQRDGAEAFQREFKPFLDGLISHYVLDGGRLAVAHAGLLEEMQNRSSGAIRSFAMYGDTTGEIDEFGLPVRVEWAAHYRGQTKVIYGHTPMPEAQWVNGTLCVDTGCVFGGKLTALRYPELDLVEVPAGETYCEPVRPLAATPEAPGDVAARATALAITDVLGKRAVETALAGVVTIREAQSAGALETMSRFAVDPRWLMYLPPTMSPVATSAQEGWLERPEEAFSHFRSLGVGHVVCEEKHMGSRAVVVVCKDGDVAQRRFKSDDRTGVVTTRTGRPFFGLERERAVLARLRSALGAAGLWEALDTDWVCLDAEIMPWSAKAQSLLERQYAPVASAADMGLGAAAEVLAAAAGRGVDVGERLERVRARHGRALAYSQAYRQYVWPVTGIDDLKIAPFHILAAEGRTFVDKPHTWHMEMLGTLTALELDDTFLYPTAWRRVDLADEGACAQAAAWWDTMTAAGGEGMVVKPDGFITRGAKGLVQPAVKVRGREYLRIIYGPDYDAPEHLLRLKERALGRKRSLALREFALGVEALERFVAHEPLARVHECVFSVLALETDPVDPRL